MTHIIVQRGCVASRFGTVAPIVWVPRQASECVNHRYALQFPTGDIAADIARTIGGESRQVPEL